MSLTKNLVASIEQTVNTFLDRLVKKYNLNKTELLNVWNSKNSQEGIVKVREEKEERNGNESKDEKQEVKTPVKLSAEVLLTSTNAELKAMCKARGLKRSGKKSELISRLLGTTTEEVEKLDVKISKPSKKKSKTSLPPVVEKLSVKQALVLRKNQFGNYSHPETDLVFDKSLGKVIGKQNDNGKVDTLSVDDIDMCKKFKFSYVTPSNLDEASEQAEVAIEELEDDMDEDDEEEEEENELEEEPKEDLEDEDDELEEELEEELLEEELDEEELEEDEDEDSL